MFGKKKKDFICLEGHGQNFNVWTDKIRIPMLGKRR